MKKFMLLPAIGLIISLFSIVNAAAQAGAGAAAPHETDEALKAARLAWAKKPDFVFKDDTGIQIISFDAIIQAYLLPPVCMDLRRFQLPTRAGFSTMYARLVHLRKISKRFRDTLTDSNIMRILFEYGYDIKLPDADGSTFLDKAVAVGNISVVNEALLNGAATTHHLDPRAKGSLYRTAAFKKSPELMRAVVEKNLRRDIDSNAINLSRTLSFTVAYGSPDVIAALLAARPFPFSKDDLNSALVKALCRDEPNRAIDTSFSARSNKLLPEDKIPQAKDDFRRIIQLLVKAGADINTPYYLGNSGRESSISFLQFASISPFVSGFPVEDALFILLEEGADPNHHNLITEYARNCNSKAVALLLAAGANPRTTNTYNNDSRPMAALDYAKETPDSPQKATTIKLLEDALVGILPIIEGFNPSRGSASCGSAGAGACGAGGACSS